MKFFLCMIRKEIRMTFLPDQRSCSFHTYLWELHLIFINRFAKKNETDAETKMQSRKSWGIGQNLWQLEGLRDMQKVETNGHELWHWHIGTTFKYSFVWIILLPTIPNILSFARISSCAFRSLLSNIHSSARMNKCVE